MTDIVNHPPHYKSGGIEVIDVIEAFGLDKSFALGNAAKYLLRAGRKGDRTTDLKKARWYLEREIGHDTPVNVSASLRDYPLVYLATPYTRYRFGIGAAFRTAAAISARLLQGGIKVYSPITHTHPIATYGEIDPLDHEIWLPFDEAMMTAASALAVVHMDGWDTSKGIAHEVAFFTRAGKPIFDLDPETLQAVPR